MATTSLMRLVLPLVLSACALERTWADIESLDRATTTGATETESETTGTETSDGPSSGVDPTSESESESDGPTTEPTTETTEPTTQPTTEPTTETEPDCGNGQVEGDEECDDGNQNNDDACLNGCLKPYCGDGFHRPEDGVQSGASRWLQSSTGRASRCSPNNSEGRSR